MSNFNCVFRRYEIKYMVTAQQRQAVLKAMEPYMLPDKYGKSTICNVYYDTPESLLVRRSMEKPIYKEKLRVRSYGPADMDKTVFVELKKKFKDVVYKRRVSMTQGQAEGYLAGDTPAQSGQITNEIDFFMKSYQGIAPAMYIAYDRTAFFGREDKEFRITFDENILWRNVDLTLDSQVYGEKLLEPGTSILEVKTLGAMPLWLSHTLCELGVYKTSFSKYGNAYKEQTTKPMKGRYCCA